MGQAQTGLLSWPPGVGLKLMEVHRVTADQYGEVASILVRAYEPLMEGYPWWPGYRSELLDTSARAPYVAVLVAQRNGAVLGTVTVDLDWDRHGNRRGLGEPAVARMLAVAPEARGSGAGRALMDSAVELARQDHRSSLTFHTMATMIAAQQLYARMGFVRDPGDDMVEEDGTVLLLAYRMELV